MYGGPEDEWRPQPTDMTPKIIQHVKACMVKGVGRLRAAMKELSPLQIHHVREKEQPSLMHYCCREADAACLLLLKHEYEFPLNVCHGDIGYPFHEACAVGNIDVVELLLTYDEAEACYNKATKYSGKLGIHIAAEHGHTDVIDAIARAQHGKNLEVRDSKGRTALHLAADRHHFAVVHHLVKLGADVKVISGEMRVAWMGAIETANYPLIKLLCPVGEEAKKVTLYSTPLQYAILEKRLDDDTTLSIAKYLVVEMGDDPNLTTGTQQTLFTMAEKKGKPKTAQWLRSVCSNSCVGLLQPPDECRPKR